MIYDLLPDKRRQVFSVMGRRILQNGIEMNHSGISVDYETKENMHELF